MKKTIFAAAAIALALPAAPAAADPPPWAPAHGKRAKDAQRYYQQRYYTSDNGVRYWRGADGALAGRAIDTRGERTTGTILGAAAGALLGKELTSGKVRCR